MAHAAMNPGHVKSFWKARAAKLGTVAFESIANLEEDPELLQLKLRLERECILPRLPLRPEATVLDLGAGVGQWSLRFAPRVAKVVAVEYTRQLADIGRAEAMRRGADNVEFVVSAAEAYESDDAFDIVFISGLFVYLTDAQVEQLVARLPQLIARGGTLLLRDGTSILRERFVITDRWSEHLRASYSAVYRRADDYRALFERAGFTLIEDGQVFEEGCPLNKYSETRLRFYLFQPGDSP